MHVRSGVCVSACVRICTTCAHVCLRMCACVYVCGEWAWVVHSLSDSVSQKRSFVWWLLLPGTSQYIKRRFADESRAEGLTGERRARLAALAAQPNTIVYG